MRAIVILTWALAAVAGAGISGLQTAAGQEYSYFSSIAGGSTGIAGWDSFTPSNPNNYIGPHAPDRVVMNANGSLLSVTPGGFKTGPNLYAFFSTPTWSIDMQGLTAAQSLTSVAVQVAVTPPEDGAPLVFDNFRLNGVTPDLFLPLGQRSSLPAGGGQPPQPVNYYWASWDGLTAANNYQLQVGPGGRHAVFAAARVDYVNTSDSSYRITSIPEPGVAGLLLAMCGGLATVRVRRK